MNEPEKSLSLIDLVKKLFSLPLLQMIIGKENKNNSDNTTTDSNNKDNSGNINIGSNNKQNSDNNTNSGNINSGNINIFNINVIIVEQNGPIKMKDADYLESDEPMSIDGVSGKLYQRTRSSYTNIGRYYSCTVNEKEITFWIGAETMKGETYVQLYTLEEPLKKLGLLKSSVNVKDRLVRIRIDEFQQTDDLKKLEVAFVDRLRIFLEDIFSN